MCFLDFWVMNMYRGGFVSFGGFQGLEICRLSLFFSKVKVKSLSEVFENLGKRFLEVGRCLFKSDLFLLFLKINFIYSVICLQQIFDFYVQGNSCGIFRKLVLFSKIFLVLDKEVLGYGRNCYDEIKEEFDKFY